MRRRTFIAGLGSAAAWPVVGLAQQRNSQYGIGHLAGPTDNPPPPPANWSAFVQGLSEAGYTEGRNIKF
jgi:putative ABC transport system substrate-binding protein